MIGSRMWDTYVFASSVEDALTRLTSLGDRGRIIAGGTDLVLQAQRGLCPARAVVDVTRIPGLSEIRQEDGHVLIGAAATHAQIADSSLVCRFAAPLSLACASIGGPQIRNVATLAGNVVNALPAADGAVALFALDAQVEVATLAGRRWVPITALYQGIGECTLDPCAEMVTAIRIPALDPAAGSAFQRLARRAAMALPVVNTAVVVRVHDGHVAEARIAVGPVAPTPLRATAAEHCLIGATPSAVLVAEAARLAACDARPRSSLLRGTATYRTAMVEVLVRRALVIALGLEE
jgi:carbon-monoxide dehydrogenase medium subunit